MSVSDAGGQQVRRPTNPLSRCLPLPARVALALAIALAAAPARADFFSSNPGPLAHAHESLDSKEKCQECHVGARELSNDRCLACHKPVAQRIADRRGLHANAKALGKPCQLCHIEHKGRGRDILGFQAFGGKDHFDHGALTGWPLSGKHGQVTCNKCHDQKTSAGTVTFLKTQQACASCHPSPHGDLREANRRCEKCHDARSWKMIERPTFEHDRDSRFPLESKHEGVSCGQCHAGKRDEPPRAQKSAPPSSGPYQKLTFRWASWSTDCQPCHANVHGEGLFGQKACKQCHSAKVEWPKVSFDHNRRTRFPLDGKHAKVDCSACHKKDDRKAPDKKCETCHPDVHKARFEKVEGATGCGTCHSASSWRSDLKFDHGGRTHFALTGKHAQAECRACHRGRGPAEYERLEGVMEKSASGRGWQAACMSCHKHENVHQKQYANDKCLDCHKMAGMSDTKPRAVNEFHGPSSSFPLTEGHKGVECAKCHLNNVFTDTPRECGPKCHADDLHKGSLGKECLSCHAGGRWEARLFDHDKQTSWPLVGNHKDVLCDQCHPRRDFAANRGKSRTCYSCHGKDDAHDGALGRRCDKCHSPDGKIFFDHNDSKFSDFPLRGAHAKQACATCHTTIRFKPTSQECGSCHPEPDIHRGQLGTLCSRCHVEEGWKKVVTGHDVPTPRFAGAHDGIACVKCHPGGRLLAGTANLCITCHRQDDVHHNALGPQCGECHTQRTFAAARFNHSRVGCDLVGVHRTLPCVQCHVGGNFTALSPECGACHRGDAVRGGSRPAAPPGHGALPTCSNCHNPNFFVGGSAPTGRESVCR